MDQPNVKVIYDRGFTDTLGIITEGGMEGWLVYRHPDGQWVTLTDMKDHRDLIPQPVDIEMMKIAGHELRSLALTSGAEASSHRADRSERKALYQQTTAAIDAWDAVLKRKEAG